MHEERIMVRSAACSKIVVGLVLTAVAGGVALFYAASPASAATKAKRRAAAEDLVKEALHREIYGAHDDRAELLESALKQLPDHPPAKWHSGYVRHQNRWVKADDIPKLLEDDRRLELYRQRRDKCPETVGGHLALADWCAERRLANQERAHLTKAGSVNMVCEAIKTV